MIRDSLGLNHLPYGEIKKFVNFNKFSSSFTTIQYLILKTFPVVEIGKYISKKSILTGIKQSLNFLKNYLLIEALVDQVYCRNKLTLILTISILTDQC